LTSHGGFRPDANTCHDGGMGLITATSVAALLAHVAFAALMVWGLAARDLRVRDVTAFVALWLAAWIELSGSVLFAPFIAALVIALAVAMIRLDPPR
jgi:hypothetical protein